MKKLLLFAAFIAMGCSSDSQEPSSISAEIAWSKTFGGSQDEVSGGLVATPDGGVIMVGHSYSQDGDISPMHANLEIVVARIDRDGNTVWKKTIGGSQDDYGTGIIATRDGNYVISGYSGSSDGDLQQNLGMHDFLLCKISPQGDVLWTKNYGFTSHDHAHKVIELRDGGFFIAGYADYAGIEGTAGDGNNGEGHEMRNTAKHGVGEYMGIRVDSAGNFMWYRYFGGTMNDRVNDIVESRDGGIIMVGYSESENFDVDDSKGSYDYWVIKLHANGMLHWKRSYGGSGIDQAFGIARTAHNSYIIAGRSNSDDQDVKNPLGNFDAWIIHIDDHGKLLWEKSFGGADYDVAATVKNTGDGKFLVAGNTRGSYSGLSNRGENDAWLFCIDAHANTKMHWQKAFGGSGIDMAADVIGHGDALYLLSDSQSADGNVPHNKGFNDFWLLKLN